MSSSLTPGSPPPLVWVTEGKTQHAAFLLESKDGKSLVKWASTSQSEWVKTDQVHWELSPRRRRLSTGSLMSSDTPQSIAKRRRTSGSSVKKQKASRRLSSDQEESAQVVLCLGASKASSPQRNPEQQKPEVSSASSCSRRDSSPRRTKHSRQSVPSIESSTSSAGAKVVPSLDQDENDDVEVLLTIWPPTPEALARASSHTGGDSKPSAGPDSGPTKGTKTTDEVSPSEPTTEEVSTKNASSTSNSDYDRERSDAVDKANVCSIEQTQQTTGKFTLSTSSDVGAVSTDEAAARPFSESSGDDLLDAEKGTGSTMLPADSDVSPAASMDETQYSCASSAYVQNIAEISYTILHDGRWRVGEDMQPLFRWEFGDDLSAVTALSRRYIPPKKPEKRFSCSCLLCQDKEVQSREMDCNDADMEDPSPPSDTTEDEEDRSLHLYCRLYYRKGPWFRLDDVYSRYYAPKEKATPIEEIPQTGTSVSKEDLAAAKENFFQPVRNGQSTLRAQKPADSLVDEELMKQHIECLSDLIQDISRLERTGLVRSFNGEEECGKTVGVSLLTTEERRQVLAKLGGDKKRRGRANGVQRLNSQNENEIWKQMSQQQSIFARVKAVVTGHKSLLPVSRHVDTIVLEKLSRSIVQACSRVEYVPAPVMRQNCTFVMNAIKSLLKDAAVNTKIVMCFLPREAPLRALQRCTRLYLCATSGPGEMRSDGTNGWKSLHDIQANPPLARVLPFPGLRAWNQITYPGLSSRFGLTSSCFAAAYESLDTTEPVSNVTGLVSKQVFFNKAAFCAWETSVELRANVDYLLELNETLRYEQRRRDRGVEPKYNVGLQVIQTDSVDFLKLLETSGRESILAKLLPALGASLTAQSIQLDLDEVESVLTDECEKILGVIAILATRLLVARHQTIGDDELSTMSSRPWLRHLWWDGCLAYFLWDIIPILERRGLYRLAVASLEVLVFGSVVDRSELLVVPSQIEDATKLAPLLLSRRARGKAYNRLVIDYNHILRQQNKAKDAAPKTDKTDSAQERIARYSELVIGNSAHKSAIPFAAIRCLARRLRRPLSDTLNGCFCLEAKELGLRLANGERAEAKSDTSKGYSDWTPITDKAVANAVSSDENAVGSRCVFVGHEDDATGFAVSDSLNVEELAMECYRTGRLPSENSSPVKGGWVGWHNEGGHIRALFRILCSAAVLGMDWGCASSVDGSSDVEQYTIHLSPYQGAPFDLHVGFELRSASDADSYPVATRSFYFRRQERINLFLDKLASLSDQDVSNLVYESVAARLRYMNERKRKDALIERDLLQLRTLSMVAAGCGGRQLASAFRCLFFDYRHYSGGLPDLHLVRALYDDGNPGLVDLGSWIGESFDASRQSNMEAQRAASMLSDKDDEFLGCSKVGDSGGRNRLNVYKTQPAASAPQRQQSKLPSLDMLPNKLELAHEGRKVKVESMLVEVKSSNDRLDPRQEDWLNVLDRYGNARVCKFEDTSKSKKKAVTKKAAASEKSFESNPESSST